MRKILVAAWALALLAVAGPVCASGVPVVDAASLAQDQVSQSMNMAKYVEMIAQYKQQIEQAKQQYKAISGTRNLGNLLNDPQYASYLPADWRKVYNSSQNGGYRGLTGTAKAMRDASRVMDTCARKPTPTEQARCRQMADKSANDAALASDAYDAASKRWDQIQGLLGQINNTTDAKSIAELQARINGETAALQNEATKLQMMQMLAAAQDKMMEQAAREATVKAIRESEYVKLKPVEYRR